ncbi:Glucosaminyl phosphatidylinositol (GlcN-PI) nositol acylation protein, partial [Dimargaris verticillata]
MAGTTVHQRAVPATPALSPERLALVHDILRLYQCDPCPERFRHYAQDAVFEDPLSYGRGLAEIKAIFYGLALIMAQSTTLEHSIVRNTPYELRVELVQRYTLRWVNVTRVLPSTVVLQFHANFPNQPGNQVTLHQDLWRGKPLPNPAHSTAAWLYLTLPRPPRLTMTDFYEYKLAKEQWVTGHQGSTLWAIAETVLASPPETKSWSAFITDYLFWALPLLLASVCISYRLEMYAAMFVGGLVLLVLTPQSQLRPPSSTGPASPSSDRKGYVSTYRATLILLTCICILAVDFPIFPRRYAKVETYGASLMDIGVGSFVFSAGLVAAKHYTRHATHRSVQSFRQEFIASVKSSAYLLLLGLGRLATIKGTEYQEHVTEYGVHWNFFFTLGLLPISVCLFQALLPQPQVSALLLAVGYQLWLSMGNLESYILHAPRDTWVSMNREGLFGFLGYLALFLLALAAGNVVLPTTRSPRSDRLHPLRLTGIAAGLCGAFALTHYGLGIPISRRLVNISYILWVAAFNMSFLTSFYLLEVVIGLKLDQASASDHDANTPWLVRAVNQNGLSTFLV